MRETTQPLKIYCSLCCSHFLHSRKLVAPVRRIFHIVNVIIYYIPKFDSWNGTRIMMCTRGTNSRTVDAISHSFAAARPSHLSETLSRWAPQRAQSIKDIAIYRGIERKRAYTCTTDMELGNALNCDSSLSFPSYVDIEFWTSFDKSDLFPSYWPRAITHLLVGREHSSPYSNILRNCDEHFAYVY